MFLKKFMVWATLVLLPTCGWAEFYRYRDANGVVHFSDSIQAVSEKQGGDLHVYADSVNTTSRPKTTVEGDHSGQTEGPATSAKAAPNDLERQLKILKVELDAAYREITEAKENLPLSPPDSDDPASIDYARQVRDLNARIAAYENKRQEYEKGVSALNLQTQAAAD